MSTYSTVQNGIPHEVSGNHGDYSGCTGAWSVSRVPPTGTTATMPLNYQSSPRVNVQDTESFSNIVHSGAIKMTELSKAKQTVKYHLFTHRQYDGVTGQVGCSLPAPNGTGGPDYTGAASWDNVWDQVRWDANHTGQGRTLKFHDDMNRRVARARTAVMANAVNSAATTLDALTTAAEGRETLRLLSGALGAVRNPMAAAKAAIEAATSPKKAADAWLSYRYGLMPLIYTVQDLVKTAEDNGFVFDRHYSSENIELSSQSPISSDHCSYQTLTGNVRVAATLKARYSSGAIRTFSSTTFNPAVTAWELIPYSFVVDWFINVGGWLQSQLYELGDLASERKSCVSEKYDYTLATRVYRNYTYHLSGCYPTSDPYGRAGNCFSVGPYNHETDDIGREERWEIYKRELFTPSDVGITFSVDMDILRWIDAVALAHGPIMKALHNLR